MSTDDSYEEEVEAPIVEEEDEEVITENDNDEQQENEVVTEPEPKQNNLAGINAKRNVNKKANSIRFFILFSQNPDKSYSEIAKSIGVSKELARKYLNELVGVVISCIDNDTYPIGVLRYYNDASIPPQQRLTAGHLQELKPVLIRYNDTNIDSLLTQKKEPEAVTITDEQMLINNAVNAEIQQEEEETSNIRTPFKKFNEFKERQDQLNTNPRVINENSPIADVIEFGINNAGVPDRAKIKRIKTLFMSSPNFYLMDEAKFVELLESNGIKDKSLSTFMNWFKNVAPIKPSERVGFLNFQKQQLQQQNGNNNGGRFNNFNISDYDDLAQFLYHEGVYSYGYPPNHPMNVQAYRRYQEDKRLEEEERKMTRQFNMAMKKQMMEMSMGGGMNRMMGQSNPNIAFDERYLVERGIVTPEISYDENGNKTVRLVPTGRTLYDTQPQQKTDSFTESLNTFARVVDAVRPMMMSSQQGQGTTQNPILDKVLTVMLERLMSKVEEDPSKVVHNQLSLLNEVKSFFPQPEQKSLTNDDIKLQIELAKINNDKVFSLKEIELKEKHHELELQRIAESKDDSKNNIEMIMGWLEKGFKVFEPILGKILLGQFGGGLSNMISGGLDTSGGLFPQQQEPVNTNAFYSQQQPQQSTMNDFIPQPQPQYEYPQQPDFSNQYVPQQQPQQQYNPQQYIPQQVVEQQTATTYMEQPSQPSQQVEQEEEEEDNFINTVSAADLETLTVSELDDIVNRFETKASKFERVLNLAKSTKARKQFGYSQSSNNNYSVLDIPSNIDKNYDGIDDDDEGGATTASPMIEIPPQG